MSAAMRKLRQFAVIEGVAVATMVAVAAAAALVASSTAVTTDAGAVASVWFLGTAVFGAPFVVLFGAPAYWALVQASRATWPWVLAAGIAPGVIVLCLNPWFGALYVACGAAVATLTHWWCGKLALIRRAHG